MFRRSEFARRSGCACAAALFAAALHIPAQAQSCNPAPLQRDGVNGRAAAVLSFAGDYDRLERDSRRVDFKRGQAYWVAASGCPRTDQVELTVTDPDGTQVLRRVGHTTGGCVRAQKDGQHTVTITPISLRAGNSWGSIAAEVNESTCK